MGLATASTMRRFVSGLYLLMLPCSVACGGKSEVERDPSGGGAPAGGGNSAAGAGIGAAGSSSQCPVEPPSQLAPCNFVVGQCNYAIDKCSSASFECLNGAWFQAPRVGGASYDCASFQAPNLPKDGDSCECLGQLDCTFNDCADRGQLHAICDNATWHVKESACAGPPCGPSSSCALGDICIVHVGFGPTFSCVPNECARLSKPVSCDCAGSACAKSEGCSIDSGALVCSCPTCI